MSSPVAAESPVEALSRWLTDEWAGPLRPTEVIPFRGEDAEEREAWYFVLVLPAPSGETWDPEEFAELQRAIRDRALEVGLPYPWYVVPRTAADESEDAVLEDDSDLPEES